MIKEHESNIKKEYDSRDIISMIRVFKGIDKNKDKSNNT